MIWPEYLSVFLVLAGTLGLFISGYWRYDIVALTALLSLVLIGVIPFQEAFTGFANPAVITVACVMVLTDAMTESGLIDKLVQAITPHGGTIVTAIAGLCLISAVLSAFMNNVGALALMMPVAIRTAQQHKSSPALFLMPIGFSSVLGGLSTAIGTPPNLLISAYRMQVTGQAFAMFDFTPVGAIVAVVATFFIALLGWRLLPERKAPARPEDLFQVHDYITEVRITEDSRAVGMTRSEFEKDIASDSVIIGLIRGKKRHVVIQPDEILFAKDILILEANPDSLEKIIKDGQLELEGGEDITRHLLGSEDVSLIEAVVPQGSRVEGRSAQRLRIRSRFQINLLAIARQGQSVKNRLNHVDFEAGDVVLLQGKSEELLESVLSLGFLPLVERGVKVGLPQRAFLPTMVFLASVMLAGLQILPIHIAFGCAVLTLVLINIIPTRRLYENIDWSIIVLLGAMIPVGGALQSSGGTKLIADTIVGLAQYTSPTVILVLLLMVTMTLSDVMNNAATAVVMAPIGVSIAHGLHANIDPFLMAVAVGASCSFLTPISHQNNTLVMGPGGYRFGDYIWLGLPVELIVLITGVPLILWYWPL